MLEKCVRTVPYGFLGVLFAIYLSQLGFDVFLIGVVLTLTVFTSAFYTFAVSFMADRYGRKRTLIFFTLMDFVAGTLLFTSTAWWAIVLAGVVGNFSVGTGEVGPFLSLEQAILPTSCDSKHRTLMFTFYNLVGYAASSIGALLAALSQHFGSGPTAYRPLFLLYLASGLMGATLYSRMSKNVEAALSSKAHTRPILSERSKPIVWKLSGLFLLTLLGEDSSCRALYPITSMNDLLCNFHHLV
jgi:MFS family permease